MLGILEKLSIKGKLKIPHHFFKSPLAFAWLFFFSILFFLYLFSFFITYTSPVSQSITTSFSGSSHTVKVGAQHEAPPQEPAYKKNAQLHSVPPGAPVAAIVITDLGLDADNLKLARETLPKEVAFALSPYTPNLNQVIQDLYADGREILLMLPMEPLDYPSSDPGPSPLLTAINPEDNLVRLRDYLKDVHHIIGVTNYMGDAFVRSIEHVRPFLIYLKSQGYLVLDTTEPGKSEISPLVTELQLTQNLVKAENLSDLTSEKGKAATLSNLERLAKRDMKVIAYATSYPTELAIISDWAKSLNEKGIQLVPLSFAQMYQTIRSSEKQKPEEEKT